MRKCVSWLPALVIPALLGAGSVSPALARGGTAGFGGNPAFSAFSVHGPRTSARSHVVRPRLTARNRAFIGRNFGVRNNLRFRGGNQFQYSWPIGIWPYSW